MAKQNKLGEILKKRNPLEERQIIKPVDVLEPIQEEYDQTERSTRSGEPNESTERTNRTDEPMKTKTPNKRTERTNQTNEPGTRTHKPGAQSERLQRTVLDELEEGTPEESKRQTERYSFEIYTDQKGSIEELQYLYKKKTGKKLSASRIIREALEEYLTKTLQTFSK